MGIHLKLDGLPQLLLDLLQLERLRVQRVQQQQQRRQLYSQPHSEHLFVAPPPPLTQNISCQHQQLQQHYGAGGGEMVDCNSVRELRGIVIGKGEGKVGSDR